MCSLEVGDVDLVEVPALALAWRRVVVPDAQEGEWTEAFGHAQHVVVDAAGWKCLESAL